MLYKSPERWRICHRQDDDNGRLKRNVSVSVKQESMGRSDLILPFGGPDGFRQNVPDIFLLVSNRP
jgi:hypothetical protein